MTLLRGNLGLDAVRALAVIAVLFSHTYEWWLPAGRDSEILAAYVGNAGVEVFFSLSGFLIGGILLRQEATGLGGRALLGFWARRWMRTLPAYWVMLALLDWRFGRWDWYTPLFLQSFVPRTEWVPLTIHTWSLVLEEWFYLFVPPLFGVALAVSRRSRWAVPCVCMGLIVGCGAARLFVEGHPTPFWGPEAGNNPILRLDCAAWGVLAACWVRSAPGWRAGWGLVGLGGAGLVLLGWVFVRSFAPDSLAGFGYDVWGRFYVPFRPSLTELFAAALVLGLRGVLTHGRGLAAGLVGVIARLSYALYLVHVPVLYLLRLAGYDDGQGWAIRGLMAVAVLGSALLLRYLVELPMLAIRDRLTLDRPFATRFQPLWRWRWPAIDVPGLLAGAACAGALAVYLIRARVGLVTLEFGDETEKYVAAVMIRQGGRLYGSIFANHGPLAYALAWLMTFVFGLEDFTQTRLVVVALALLACLAVATSPALPRRGAARLWAVSLFLAPISSLWFVHPLHMLIYHALGGYLLLIVIAQLSVPAVLGARVGWWGAVVSGAAVLLAVCAAYPFAAAGALFVAAALLAVWLQGGWVPVWRMAVWLGVGAIGAAVPMAVWITWCADWAGLYTYHLYFNQVIYGRIIGYAPWNVFHGLVLSSAPAARPHSLALVAGALGLVGLVRWQRPGLRLATVVVLALGMLMLNPKGEASFPDTAQMIACFGLLALVGGRVLAEVRGRMLVAGVAASGVFVAGAEGVARTALVSPHGMRRAEAPLYFLRPTPGDPIVAEIQRSVPPGGTMLALPFIPALYLLADRAPASGQYYYLPFQAEYDKAPLAGRTIDLCGDIDRLRPRAIVVAPQPFPVWGTILDYKACVAQVLVRDYAPSAVIPFVYLRRVAPQSPPHPSDGAGPSEAAHMKEKELP